MEQKCSGSSKSEHDNQTIGLLICKDKDDVVAEYELTKALSSELQSSLPTIEEIERELTE